MNIKSPNINQTTETVTNANKKSSANSDVKFSDELKTLEKSEKNVNNDKEIKTKKDEKLEENESIDKKTEDEDMVIEEDQNSEVVGNAIIDLSDVLHELNQSDDKFNLKYKDIKIHADNDSEGTDVINNDFNIENKDKLPQMTPNMNFGGDGQPFSSFMNNDSNQKKEMLSSSAKDLAEEAAILSTMADNVAMVNKISNIDGQKADEIVNSELQKERIVYKEDGIKKVDTKTNIIKETVVKYDTVVMNEADVEVFANLVQNGEVDMNNLAPEAAQKSVQVSKTLADMLAKAMEDNKPIRIEFDNGISVIIKISREGKLTADFLPSTQIAEAYLKENLPLLKQRFDEQNIEYDELNRRERKEHNKEQDRKKGRENE